MTFRADRAGRVVRRLAAAGLLGLLVCAPVHAAERYDPRLRFRTISTPRFDIHFHQGQDAFARRLARIAEEVAARLDRELGRPSGRVHVILVNQTDLPNGWATPIPYNLIEINTVSPPGESIIGNTDDWLALVFSHEYTHIVHLDAARGWIGGLRRVFGRLSPLYPNLFLPQWQIEGIATYTETRLTGEGRLPAGDFRLMLDRAVRSRRFEPLDRAGGGLVDWPVGHAPYLYGSYFHQYLSDRFGPESLARLSRETAGRLPYFGSLAFRKVFGRSLGALWKEFQADAAQKARTDEPAGTRLTHHGFTVSAPRFSDDGRLFYSMLDTHGFPALMERSREGHAPRRVTTRYLGGRLATTRGRLVFDQLDLVRSVGLQSDLYAVAEDGGSTRRLTHEARAGDPDVSADGSTVVCTIQKGDRRELATFAMPLDGAVGLPAPLLSEEFTEFSAPRWSADGRSIAVERRRLGGPSEIVLVDPATRQITPVVSSGEGRNIGPVWLPDGRSILFASDRDGAFRLYSAEVSTGATRRLDGTGSGAQSPALSPDGTTLVYVGYTPDGFDLFSIPIAAATWTAVESARTNPSVSPTSQAEAAPAGDGAPYRPWRTLLPRFWAPVIESDAGELLAGAGTSSFDVLGRHAYLASVAWSASRARPDWQVAYAYDRWRPTVFANVSSDVDPFRLGEVRSLEVNAGILLPMRRVRWSQTALAALHVSNDTFECHACERPIDTVARRRALRLGWIFDRAHSYGYSISAEEGARIAVTSETSHAALGAQGDAGAITIDARGYRRVFPRHGVLAARVAAATSWGDRSVGREFTIAGAGPPSGAFGFGRDAIALLRGFDEGSIAGQHAALANVDYRIPLRSLQRGIGTLPFFLRTVHGAVFADAGHAWTDTARWSELQTALGAELSVDLVISYLQPLTITTGAAWRNDRAAGRSGVVAFGRIGRAF